MQTEHTPHRIGRLLALVREIKTRPDHSPESMLSTLGVSKAQFHRDKDELESLGFIFHFDRGQKRYVLDQDCYLPMENLNLDEIFALVLAVDQLTNSGDYLLTRQAVQAAMKLITPLGDNLRKHCSGLLENGETKAGPEAKSGAIADLQSALDQGRRIEIEYQKPGQDNAQTLEIDPYALFFRDGFLYLDAYSLTSKEVRTFRVSRIKSLRFTSLFFKAPRKGYSHVSRYQNAFGVFADGPLEQVTVLFTKKARPYIEEVVWHQSQTITPQDNGGILFKVLVAHPREVLWWCLRWGDQAEIMEPAWLRQEAGEAVRKMAKRYQA